MESKNTATMIGIFAVGIFIGFLVWGMDGRGYQSGMHKMPDGTWMSNDGSSMEDMMHDMMSGLKGKTGDDFDKAFINEMIVHHEGAVDMAEAVLENSKRDELIKLANEIISAQTKEIEMMKDWREKWFR